VVAMIYANCIYHNNKRIFYSRCDLRRGRRSLNKWTFWKHTSAMDKDAVRVIVTGGTFDKQYDEIRGELTFRQSQLPEILRRARVTIPVEIELNQLIDSLQMQDANRDSVLAACRRAPEGRIVITHGTDTMTATASLLGGASLGKTIVLTGAMIPYQIQDSDALFNFGTAFAASQLLLPGVYIAMNGRIFEWAKVRKNRELGVFVDKAAD
jgi:L-asparaginase